MDLPFSWLNSFIDRFTKPAFCIYSRTRRISALLGHTACVDIALRTLFSMQLSAEMPPDRFGIDSRAKIAGQSRQNDCAGNGRLSVQI
jgi:hypothetical protein